MEIAVGNWVATPDGEGEVVGYEPEQAQPYSVMLDRIGADASADNLRVYTAGELLPAHPPQWKVLRDSERRSEKPRTS